MVATKNGQVVEIMGKNLSRASLARLLGRNVKILDDWLAKGCPHRRRGREYSFDLAEVITWREGYLTSHQDLTSQPGGGQGNGQASSLTAEKSRLAREQADKLALENAATRGLLVETAEIDKLVTAWAVEVKTAVLAIPSRAAPLLARTAKAAMCEEILTNYCYEALDRPVEGRFAVREGDGFRLGVGPLPAASAETDG